MTIKMNPQLNLLLGLSKPDISLDEKIQAELVKELANLIFLFSETENKTDNTLVETINE